MRFTEFPNRKRREPARPHPTRLRLERLEDRTMPSTNIVEVEPNNTMSLANAAPLGFDADEDTRVTVSGATLALSHHRKSEPEVTCSPRLGCGNEGRSALMVAGDPNGDPPDSPDNRIDPNTASSPFAGVGSLRTVFQAGNAVPFVGFGSAVAIGPRHVLTAAHVLDANMNGRIDEGDDNVVEFWLNLDTDTPEDQPDVIIPAARWYIHPDAFNPGNALFHDDIAVIELSTPLPAGVPFYQLYTQDLTGQTIHMVGYGRSGDGLNGFTVPASRTVKRVGQNVADYFEGQDDHRRPEAIELWRADFDHPTDPSLNLFGGSSLGNDIEASPGPGDSGGPAFVLVGNNPNKASSYQIGGVITHGIEGLSTFGLFGSGFGGTVVSAYLDWIQAILAGSLPASEGGELSGGTRGGGGSGKGDTSLTRGISAGLNWADFASLALVHTITLDDAAGGCWFLDPTPPDDSEFITPGDQGEQNRMDLFPVIAPELGHVLGLDHDEGAGSVMGEELTAGTRRTPTGGLNAGTLDRVFAELALFHASEASRKR